MSEGIKFYKVKKMNQDDEIIVCESCFNEEDDKKIVEMKTPTLDCSVCGQQRRPPLSFPSVR